MTLITIFTAPKPFKNPHICLIQRNAILSWKNLGPQVEVILVGNEEGIGEAASDLGVGFIPEVRRNSYGTPLVNSIFQVAREATSSPLMAYFNADILALPDFLQSSDLVSQKLDRFLIIGRRWDLDIREPIDFSGDWETWLKAQTHERGRAHPPSGSDYFIYPRNCFTEFPDFAIGRVCWDNWAIYYARQQGMAVINASQAITIIHQDHDYSHLPGGRPSYRGPEANKNLEYAGGKRDMFTQQDSTHYLEGGNLRRAPLTWKRFWREVEIFPLVTMHSTFIGQLLFGIFHPIKAYPEIRDWLKHCARKPVEK